MSNLDDADAFLDFIRLSFVETGPPDPALVQLARGPVAVVRPPPVPVPVPAGRVAGAVRSGEGQGCLAASAPPPAGADAAGADAAVAGADPSAGAECATAHVEVLCVFPVKSCAAFTVHSWEISATGFLYDRHWLVLNEHGGCLTQKQEPKMCQITPEICLSQRELTLRAPRMAPITVPLDSTLGEGGADTTTICRARVCMDKIAAIDCGAAVGAWLSSFLGQPCRLVRQNRSELRTCVLDTKAAPELKEASRLSFSNESQFLVTSSSSMREVNMHTVPGSDVIPVDRFRGNIVAGGGRAFEEDGWGLVAIGSQLFRVVGACRRCQMICVDQNTGQRTSEPLLSLAKFRRLQGQTFFGQYLVHLPNESTLPFRISSSDIITTSF